MSDKRPQPTTVLIQRLRRVAKYHDDVARTLGHPADAARANTCWQAAARLDELLRTLRGSPLAPDAVDPQAGSTGPTSPRVENSSSSS